MVVVSGWVETLPGSAVNHVPEPHCPPESRQEEKLLPLVPLHDRVLAPPCATEPGLAVKEERVVGGAGGVGTTVSELHPFPSEEPHPPETLWQYISYAVGPVIGPVYTLPYWPLTCA